MLTQPAQSTDLKIGMMVLLLSNTGDGLGFRTMLLGAVSYGLAALCCAAAWRRESSARLGRYWAWLSIGYLVMAVETFAKTRHVLSKWGIWAVGRQLYLERHGPQLMLCGLLGVIGLLIVAWLGQRMGRWSGLAGAGLVFAIYSFLLAAISAHLVDRILYLPAGGVLLVGWGWAVAGLLGIFGGLAAREGWFIASPSQASGRP